MSPRPNRRKEGVTREPRRSVAVWGDHADRRWQRLRRSIARARTFYAFMLYQDVQHQIVPTRAREHGFRVDVISDDAAKVRDVIALGLGRESNRSHLEGAIETWLEEAATALVLCGRVAYEILYLIDDATEEAIGFELELLPAGAHFRRWGREYQYVPAGEDRRGRTVQLDLNQLIVAEFPPQRRRRMQRAFAALDMATEFSAATSKLMEATMFNGLPYDFPVHRRSLEVAVARSTAIFGWNARTTFADRQLEPYRIWREIRFEAFKIELRQILVDALNGGLDRIGDRLRWVAKLELQGLPTSEDIRQAESHLREGTRGVNEILKPFHPWLIGGTPSNETDLGV